MASKREGTIHGGSKECIIKILLSMFQIRCNRVYVEVSSRQKHSRRMMQYFGERCSRTDSTWHRRQLIGSMQQGTEEEKLHTVPITNSSHTVTPPLEPFPTLGTLSLSFPYSVPILTTCKMYINCIDPVLLLSTALTKGGHGVHAGQQHPIGQLLT